MDAISDMYLAAALLAYGAELEGIDRSDPKRQKFRFSGEIKQVFTLSDNVVLRIESPSFDDVRTRFVGRTLVYPPSYVDAIRRIKAAIHDV